MPNPTQSDLHINVPLTNISIAYIQNTDEYVADRVFPRVPVEKQSNLFWRYRKSEWRREDVQKRAPSTETPGVGWNTYTDQYFCHVYGVHKDIDDQLRANADSAFNLDRDATTFVTNQLLLKRDKDWVDTYFKAGVWDTDKTGGTDFTLWSAAGSDPIGDFTTEGINVRESTGMSPNTIVIGPRVFNTLRNHADVLDRIKYTQRGIVTEDLLASLFGVERILVAYASENTGEEHQQPADTDTNATYSFLSGNNALLAYVNKAPSLMTPSAGYIFTWKGYLGGNDRGVRIKRFRQERIASDRIEGEMTYDQKVVASDLAVFFGGAIA